MLTRFLKLSCYMVGILMSLASCSSYRLATTKVAYQSIRTTEYHDAISDDAKIAVGYEFTTDGYLIVAVHNRTDEVMTIDNTKSFFVDTDGHSTSYYDPTVRTTTVTDISSSTTGASVNLGSLARAVGIGGIVGGVLSGVNIGESDTNGQSISKATYIADLPQVSLAPRGTGIMAKEFGVTGVGKDALKGAVNSFNATSPQASPYRFSVCVTYSLDGGNTYEKIVTDFYVNAQIIENVREYGHVNDALKQLYLNKPDALYEPCWFLHFVNNISSEHKHNVFDIKQEGALMDCK